MEKNEKIVFKKYGQFYEGTLQSADGNKVKVASLSGGIHTVDRSDVQTVEAYVASRKVLEEAEVN